MLRPHLFLSFTSSEDSEVERKKLIEKASSELTNIKVSLDLAKDAKDIDILKYIQKKKR